MQFFSQINQDVELLLIAIFSLVFGSFVSFITYRLGNSKNLLAASSICVNCGCKLKILNLIPLFSYLFQRGKCGKCESKISLRYPMIELGSLVAFLAVYFSLGREVSLVMMLYFAIAILLVAIATVDIEHYFIPDSLQYILAILVVILTVYSGGSSAILTNVKSAFLYSIFGLALWVFFYFAARVEAIGIDDIKFFFVAGLLLGQGNFLTFMMLTGVAGVIFGSIWQKVQEDETFPFAPTLCLSLFVTMLLGDKFDVVETLGALLYF
jgi:leader peptidase (prepilin peptidase)/N-methyltransferase